MGEIPEGTIACVAMDGTVRHVPVAEVVHRVSAYALVVDRGRLLMIRLAENGKLFLPGGGSEPWENLHETVRREGKKETGLFLEPGGLVSVAQGNFYLPHHVDAPAKNCVMHFFRATVVGDPDALVAGDLLEGTPEWVPLRSIVPEAVHLPLVDILPEIIKDL